MTFSNLTKNTTTLTGLSKSTSTFTALTKNIVSYLLTESGFFLLLETGDRIVLSGSTTMDEWTNETKHG